MLQAVGQIGSAKRKGNILNRAIRLNFLSSIGFVQSNSTQIKSHRLGGGGGRIRPPLGFSGITSSFFTVSTWNLAHLSGHQFSVVSCKENKNRPEIFCYKSNFVTSLHAIYGRWKVNVWKFTKNRIFKSNVNKKWMIHKKARSTKWLSRIF